MSQSLPSGASSPPGSVRQHPTGAGPFRHLVLVGLSGSGKSTVGRDLAARLDRRFVDTDEVIVAMTGRSIPELFATDGEAVFRQIERRAVAAALDGPPAVIATGGGAPIDPENRAALWRGNVVIWLDAPVTTLVARVGTAGRGRPLLSGDAARRLAALRRARQDVYATAHLHVDTRRLTAGRVATTILSYLDGLGPAGSCAPRERPVQSAGQENEPHGDEPR